MLGVKRNHFIINESCERMERLRRTVRDFSQRLVKMNQQAEIFIHKAQQEKENKKTTSGK